MMLGTEGPQQTRGKAPLNPMYVPSGVLAGGALGGYVPSQVGFLRSEP